MDSSAPGGLTNDALHLLPQLLLSGSASQPQAAAPDRLPTVSPNLPWALVSFMPEGGGPCPHRGCAWGEGTECRVSRVGLRGVQHLTQAPYIGGTQEIAGQ